MYTNISTYAYIHIQILKHVCVFVAYVSRYVVLGM